MSELLINDIKSNNSELKSYNEGMQIIEEMSEVLKNYTERNYIMASHVILECYAEELYSKNYRKQEWISVDERLPERAEDYICRCIIRDNFDYPFYMILRYILIDENPHFQHECENGLKVTHWMPLPEAPKMKNTEI